MCKAMVQVITLVQLSIESRLEHLKEELQNLIDYPDEKLVDIIKELGFECNLCGKCCTIEFNDHVFLLDKDTAAIKQIDASALIPAPYYEFCDQHGSFYVSGYALKTDSDGSCFFLDENKRCQIYDQRLTICRIYPYMLHREADEEGNIDWRQISGLNEHGFYHTEIDDSKCRQIARETKDYEIAFLEHEIEFLRAVQAYFQKNKLKHVQRTYDARIREFKNGKEIEVFVYYYGRFEKNIVTIHDY
jgi:Fe-S-cluster containining protein